jgi:hypothetical protein
MSYGLERALNAYFEVLSQRKRKTTEDWWYVLIQLTLI